MKMKQLTSAARVETCEGLIRALLIVVAVMVVAPLVTVARANDDLSAPKSSTKTNAQPAPHKAGHTNPAASKVDEAKSVPDNADVLPPTLTTRRDLETVRLADGKELSVEKFGDTHFGYQYHHPIAIDDTAITVIVDYHTLKRGHQGITSLQLDAEASKLYWTDYLYTHRLGHVVSANVDGSHVSDLVSNLLRPRSLVLAKDSSQLYWLDGESRNDQMLSTSDLMGKSAKALVDGLDPSYGLTLDARRHELYFWDERRRIVRIGTNGDGEELILEGGQRTGVGVSEMHWNSLDERLYWTTSSDIRRCSRDGSKVETVVRLSGDGYQFGRSYHFTFDNENSKIYFTNSQYGQVLRADMDGSKMEVLVTNPRHDPNSEIKAGTGPLAIDEVHKTLYWGGARSVGGDASARIYRTALPAVSKATAMRPPPLIKSIDPMECTVGENLTLEGEYLKDASAVIFVDDSNGKHMPAAFKATSDEALTAVVPAMSDKCVQPWLVVQTPSGVTFTLRNDATIVNSHRPWKHNSLHRDVPRQFWVRSNSSAVNMEFTVAYAESEAHISGGPRGSNTIFAANGSRIGVQHAKNSVLYHEPFFVTNKIQDVDPTLKMISVPAIRPSLLNAAITFHTKDHAQK